MSTGRISVFPHPPIDDDLYSIPESTSLLELETAVNGLSVHRNEWIDGHRAAARKLLAASHMAALSGYQVFNPEQGSDKNGLPQGLAFSLSYAVMALADVAKQYGIDLEQCISSIQHFRIEHPEMETLSEKLTAPATIYMQKERK